MRNIPVLFAVLLLASATAVTASEIPVRGPETEQVPTAVPALLHYQAKFTNDAGVALAGPVKLTFSFYAAATGGAALWTEIHNAVPLTDGVGGVLLGSLNPLAFETLNQESLYLGVAVNEDPELSPRARVASVPYAVDASRLQGKQAVDFEPKGAVLVLSLSDGTPPNQGENRVHWDILRGVPEGFADGIDTGVTDHGALTGLADDDHPQYARETDLAGSSGSGPNTGKNLVHWENLVGVPSGFADGADNTGAGGGVSDHGELTGLEDDDHPQYATDADLGAHVAADDPHPGYVQDAQLTTHQADPSAHHTKTVNASELTAGTLGAARLPQAGVTASVIAQNAVNGSHINAGTVTSADLAPNAVTESDIAVGAVTGAKVQDGSLTGNDIAVSSVPADRLAPGSITATQLAPAAFDSTNLTDGGVSRADLAPGLIDSGLIAPGAVDSVHLAPGSVAAVQLAPGAVRAPALADSAITAPALAPGAVGTEAVADESLTGEDLKNNSVTAADIADEAGVEFATAAGPLAVGTTTQSLFSHTILPPEGGWVLAVLTGTACLDGPGGGADMTVTVSVSGTENLLDPASQVQVKHFVVPGARDCTPFAVQALIPVLANTTRTVYATAQRVGGSSADLTGLALSLVFLPTRY